MQTKFGIKGLHSVQLLVFISTPGRDEPKYSRNWRSTLQ